jgi:alcohol dehydrogenase class IV
VVLPVREFRVPAVIFGSGSATKAGEECRRQGVKRVLLVTDPTVVKLGLAGLIEKSLSESEVSCVVYDGVTTEPVVEFVEQGLGLFSERKCDGVLALGGGSALDAAKAIALMTTNPGRISDYKGLGKVGKRGAPLVAIPTTAGTGSEATVYTIITDSRTNVKMLIGSPFLMPDVAIVDPLLTLQCPPSVTAATGMDALVHAIEAYVSRKAHLLSDPFALRAIGLVSGSLRRAWTNGKDAEAREKVMLGALEAGIAFSNASVGLVHGMSRPIGAHFHVAHGVSNACLLIPVMRFSLPAALSRYADVARAMGVPVEGLTDLEAAEAGVEAAARLVKDIQIPPLHDLVKDKAEFGRAVAQMAKDAIASGSPGNNPRLASEEEIVALYQEVYAA